MISRCDWATDKILQKYHDLEWGVPLHKDRKLFEFLLLDGAQAGLSWSTILNRREEYREAFDNFNPKKIAVYTESDISHLLKNDGIVRNRKKVESAVNNAGVFLEVQKEFGTFDRYVWRFTEHRTIVNSYGKWSDIPPSSSESKEMSADMKRRGFTFVGPTICYAFMQSAGMVNDHVTKCFRRAEIKNLKK